MARAQRDDMDATATKTTAELDAELNKMILEGKALEAFERFYGEECVMMGPRRVGNSRGEYEV